MASPLDSLDLRFLEDALASQEVQARLSAKICFELHSLFLAESVRAVAWPMSDIAEEVPAKPDWLPPGAYPFGELEDRLAPRLAQAPTIPDPRYRPCETAVESAVLSYIKTLLVLPEQQILRDQAAAQNVDPDKLINVCMELVGAPVIEQLMQFVKGFAIELRPEKMAMAGRLHMLSEVTELAERHHVRRCLLANEETYERLRLQWTDLAGPAAAERLTLKSPLLPTFHKWLQSLPIAEAALFLMMHDASAGVSAGKGLPAEYVQALGEATMPLAPVQRDVVYSRLRDLFTDLLSIPGKRVVTVSTIDNRHLAFDLDACNRVGHKETHLGLLIDVLYDGFIHNAGVMVRAMPGQTVNIYAPEKGEFELHLVRNLYAARIVNRRTQGLSAAEVLHAHTTDPNTGETTPRHPTIVPCAWPIRRRITRQAALPPRTPRKQLPPKAPPEPPIGA